MTPLWDVVNIASALVLMLSDWGVLGNLRSRLAGKDTEVGLASVRMIRAESEIDHGKAVRELDWSRVRSRILIH